MRVIYEKVSEAIIRYVEDADIRDRKIKKIILTKAEWAELMAECKPMHFHHRPDRTLVIQFYGVTIECEQEDKPNDR